MIVRRLQPFGRGLLGHLEQRQREMDGLFEALQRAFSEEPIAGVYPAMNVTQNSESFHVRIELPGVKADDLEVSALKNKLTISGHRDLENEKESVSYHRREREGGSFSRTIVLPGEIDAEAVRAGYNNGILTITLQKAAEAKPKMVAVRT